MKFTIGDLVSCFGFPFGKKVRDGDLGRVREVIPSSDPINLQNRYEVELIVGNAADGSVYNIEEKYLSPAKEVDLGALQSARLYPADSPGQFILVIELNLSPDKK